MKLRLEDKEFLLECARTASSYEQEKKEYERKFLPRGAGAFLLVYLLLTLIDQPNDFSFLEAVGSFGVLAIFIWGSISIYGIATSKFKQKILFDQLITQDMELFNKKYSKKVKIDERMYNKRDNFLLIVEVLFSHKGIEKYFNPYSQESFE